MEMVEILDEMVEYYSTDPEKFRGVDSAGYCVYWQPVTGVKCAVGRCIQPKCLQKMRDQHISGSVFTIAQVFENKLGLSLDDVLLPQYRGHHIKFWGALQSLHDGNGNWGPEGLTDEGKDTVESIRTKINTGFWHE